MILWDSTTGEPERTLSDHEGYLWDVAFSPDGTQIVTAGGPDLTARVWAVETGEVIAELEHPSDVQGAAWSDDGRFVLTGCADGTAYLWEVETAEIVETFSGHMNRVNGVALSPDGFRAAAASDDGSVMIWRIESALALTDTP